LRRVATAFATTACASSTVVASGFSTKTWQPPSMARSASAACVFGQVLIETASGGVVASASS
jgi:hypothetical protein